MTSTEDASKPTDDLEVRRAVEWFKSFMTAEEWAARREAALLHFYETALGRKPKRPSNPSRFYSEEDIAGWYLLLAESLIDNPADYEPSAGARVVPIFKAIGRDLEYLLAVEGIEERAHRFIHAEKKQPDAGLYELLVAMAYKRQGWPTVRFIPEEPGKKKTHDLEISGIGLEYAVECKRMNKSPYAQKERDRFWELWRPIGPIVEKNKVSVLYDITFKKELIEVPDNYLVDRFESFVKSKKQEEIWSDEFVDGQLINLNLEALKKELETDVVLHPSQRFFELLVGEYSRYASYTGFGQCLPWRRNPRYVDDVRFYSLARWRCLAPKSINAKARHILRQVAKANDQLPTDKPGVIHVGLEALDGDYVETIRYPKIVEQLNAFNPKGKPLSWIYCNYFVPESPPDESWAFDETVAYFKVTEAEVLEPLPSRFLVLPKTEVQTRNGVHWD